MEIFTNCRPSNYRCDTAFTHHRSASTAGEIGFCSERGLLTPGVQLRVFPPDWKFSLFLFFKKEKFCFCTCNGVCGLVPLPSLRTLTAPHRSGKRKLRGERLINKIMIQISTWVLFLYNKCNTLQKLCNYKANHKHCFPKKSRILSDMAMFRQ